MANPNLLNITSITAHSEGAALSGTSNTLITAATNTVVKVVSVYCTNTTTATKSVTIKQGTLNVVFELDIPPDSTVQLVTKDAPLYLTEGETFSALANSSGLEMNVYYETMS
jgi:hypothetical protein